VRKVLIKCLLYLKFAFGALTLLDGRQEEQPVCKIALERDANNLHGPADATAIPSSLDSVKSRMVFT